MDDQQMETALSEQEVIRRKKLAALVEEGVDPFLITRFGQDWYSGDIIAQFPLQRDEMGQNPCHIAGRMMYKRIMGKASFFHLLDLKGSIQVYVRRDDIGEGAYGRFKEMDIGDILGVSGPVFETKTGEITVHAKELTLLAKAIKPLPEKFHGLKDPDLRYRMRSVDLIVNPEVRDVFILRSRIISAIRRYLDGLNFIEVETPVLNTVASGAQARPFLTHHNALNIDMHLRIALELRLKQLIVGGLERVYEIGRNFRNEGMDSTHNPEFTMLELYQAYTNLDGMMEIAEGIFSHCAMAARGSLEVTYQGEKVNLKPPFARMSMNDAVKQKTGADFMACGSNEEAHTLAKSIGLKLEAMNATRGEILAEAFAAFVEDTIVQPVFITDYPIEISPLAKKKPGFPGITERFELFIMGHEYANAFSELNDPIDQRARFVQQAEQRSRGNDEAMAIDEEFCESLEYGMPPTGGIGIGIDRLVMLMTDCASIRDVLLFPTMKPKA